MEHHDDDGLGLDASLGLEEKPAFSAFEKAAGQLALDIAGALCKFAKEFGYSPEETLFPKVKKGRKGNRERERERLTMFRYCLCRYTHEPNFSLPSKRGGI